MKRAAVALPALWAGHEAPPPRAQQQVDVFHLTEAKPSAAFAHWRRGLLISFVLHGGLLAFCLLHGDVASTGDGSPVYKLTLVSASGNSSHVTPSALQGAISPEPQQAKAERKSVPAIQPPPARQSQKFQKQTRERRQNQKASVASMPKTGVISTGTSSTQITRQGLSRSNSEGTAVGDMGYGDVFAPGELDRPPTLLRHVRPEYPPEARKKRTEGRVLVRLIVDSKGLPTQCAIHAAAPPGYFEAAALEAARKMHFSPGRKDGRAVRTVVLLPFDFKLR